MCVQFCWPVHCFLCFTTFVGCSCVDYFPAVGDKVVFVASVQFYEYVFHPIGKQFQLQDSINRPKICVGSRAYGVCEAAKCLRYKYLVEQFGWVPGSEYNELPWRPKRRRSRKVGKGVCCVDPRDIGVEG